MADICIKDWLAMRVLVACERSGIVRQAFRDLGHDAWSCDLEPAEDGSKFHIIGDAIYVGMSRVWDFGIMHPPCTRLANSGSLRLYIGGKKVNGIDPQNWQDMKDGALFFAQCWNLPIEKLCLENPIIHCHAVAEIRRHLTRPFPKPQLIQPFQFGHPESKGTNLWLRNLQKLNHTNVLPLPECGHWENQTPSGQNKLAPSAHRAMDRARTYSGIAKAMAECWGKDSLANFQLI